MAASHLLREPLDNGGLADTGLADKGEVVLGATGEDLQHALRLVLAPQNRVELPSRASWVMSCPCFASILSGSREPSPRSPFKAARRSVSVRPTPPPAARWPPCPHPRVEGPRGGAPCPPPAGRGFARLLAGELQGALGTGGGSGVSGHHLREPRYASGRGRYALRRRWSSTARGRGRAKAPRRPSVRRLPVGRAGPGGGASCPRGQSVRSSAPNHRPRHVHGLPRVLRKFAQVRTISPERP